MSLNPSEGLVFDAMEASVTNVSTHQNSLPTFARCTPFAQLFFAVKVCYEYICLTLSNQ